MASLLQSERHPPPPLSPSHWARAARPLKLPHKKISINRDAGTPSQTHFRHFSEITRYPFILPWHCQAGPGHPQHLALPGSWPRWPAGMGPNQLLETWRAVRRSCFRDLSKVLRPVTALENRSAAGIVGPFSRGFMCGFRTDVCSCVCACLGLSTI